MKYKVSVYINGVASVEFFNTLEEANAYFDEVDYLDFGEGESMILEAVE
jgi:hypothetical protein